MARNPLIEKLRETARRDLADFEALLGICEREIGCAAGEELEALSAIGEEKEALIRKIQESSDRSVPLWARLEEEPASDSDLDDLNRLVDEIRRTVEAIRKAEDRLAEALAGRAGEVRKAMGSLSRAGKAVGAYAPSRTYAPRFIDKKE